MKPKFDPKAVTCTLRFGATSDHAHIHTPSGTQVVDLSQFRSAVSILAQEPGESQLDFRKRVSTMHRQAKHQRHAALELILDFVLAARDMSHATR